MTIWRAIWRALSCEMSLSTDGHSEWCIGSSHCRYFPATEHHSWNTKGNGALSGKWIVKKKCELHFVLMTQTMDDNSHLSLLIIYLSFIHYEFHVLPTCLRQMCFQIMWECDIINTSVNIVGCTLRIGTLSFAQVVLKTAFNHCSVEYYTSLLH